MISSTGSRRVANAHLITLLVCLVGFSGEPFAASSVKPAKAHPDKDAAVATQFKFLKQGHLLLELGGHWRTAATSQFININGLIGDRFTVTNGQNGNGLVGVGYFIDGKDKERLKMSYGINWFYLPKTSVSGTVVQEDLFENLSYSYNITNYPLYAVAKSTLKTSSPNYNVTLNAGIGPNFMALGQFKENSISGSNVVSLPDQIFSGKKSAVFSATAGLGFQLANILGKMPIECGYQFFYLGQGSMSVINEQVQNTLKTGTLYANAVMCSLST
jgi:hypothetical protein